MFFQMIVFGHVGQIGHLVQKHVGAEPVLNHVPRLGPNKMVEVVQDPQVTAKIAIHSLVQVNKLLYLLTYCFLRRTPHC